MKSVTATEAKNRLGAILDDAQREPIVIRRQDRDIAVVLSMADYERLRSGNIQAFLSLRNGTTPVFHQRHVGWVLRSPEMLGDTDQDLHREYEFVVQPRLAGHAPTLF